MSSAIIYNGHDKSFNSILTENNLKTIHKKTLEFLAIKIHKFQNGLPPPIKNDIFFSNIYNLRKFQELSTSTKYTLNFGTEAYKMAFYRGPQLWNLIPDNIKSKPTLEPFKKKTRKCKCETSPCSVCKLICNILALSANKNSINFANGSY